MKRLLALLLLLCLLTGCGAAPAEPSEPVKPSFVPAEPEPAQEPEPDPEPSLMDGRQPVEGCASLYELTGSDITANNYQDLYPFGEALLASGLDYESAPDGSGVLTIHTRLAVIDQDTGKTLTETTLSDVDTPAIQVCGSTVAVCDWGLGRVFLLNEDLSVRLEQNIKPTGYQPEESSWCTSYVSTDASTAYAVAETALVAVDLASGSQTPVLEGVSGLYAGTLSGSAVSLNYIDISTQRTCYAVLDLTSGEVLPVPFSGNFYSTQYSGGVWLAGVSSSSSFGRYLFGTAENAGFLEMEEGTPELLPSPPRLMTNTVSADGNSRVLTLYGADGSFLATGSLPNDYDTYESSLVWSEQYGGYFFTSTRYDGLVHLYFWEPDLTGTGEALSLRPLSEIQPEVGGSAVAQELYDRAAAIGETYGVTVRIADQCPTEYSTYRADQDLDYWHISDGLTILETALSSYPDGFFSQLLYGSYQEIVINLTGTIYSGAPEDSNGFTSFAAFVEQQDWTHVMVADLGQGSGLLENFYHEFSHIIDGKLDFDAMLRPEALYSEAGWSALNPPDFSYTYDYYNLPEDIYLDGYDSYFVDTYSRTFPTEDRARVLENAMAGWDWYFRDGQHAPLREKLTYYAACIRDAFDTTGWPDVTLWEKPLQP